MVKKIRPHESGPELDEAVDKFRQAGKVVALTGAGISVESGIPDFRSPDGLWNRFSPGEFATLRIFLQNPSKAWTLFRALGKVLQDKQPNAAHLALARLESAGRLAGVITQNVDGLHQAAGSKNVVELHGDHQHLECLNCQKREEAGADYLDPTRGVPRCEACGHPLKPSVVLFGENVRGMDEVTTLLEGCDLLLVIGTSAQVYPAAGLPFLVKNEGGTIFEYNLEPTELTSGMSQSGFFGHLLHLPGKSAGSDFFFQGKATETVAPLVDRVLNP